MKTMKFALIAAFSILLAVPAFAVGTADAGGSSNTDVAMAVTNGHPSIGPGTPNCTDCLMKPLAKGDLGVTNGTFTPGSLTHDPTKVSVPPAGSSK